jgi:hypothetical protein
MNKAPERIWVDRTGNVYDRDVSSEIRATGYIRADLAGREASWPHRPTPAEPVVGPDIVGQGGVEPSQDEAAVELEKLRAEVERLGADKAELVAILAESQASIGGDWPERRDAILTKQGPGFR